MTQYGIINGKNQFKGRIVNNPSVLTTCHKEIIDAVPIDLDPNLFYKGLPIIEYDGTTLTRKFTIVPNPKAKDYLLRILEQKFKDSHSTDTTSFYSSIDFYIVIKEAEAFLEESLSTNRIPVAGEFELIDLLTEEGQCPLSTVQKLLKEYELKKSLLTNKIKKFIKIKKLIKEEEDIFLLEKTIKNITFL
jgi:hypothetical protein